MPSAVYKKTKERIVLALRIKRSNKEAELCSRCRRNSRRCLVDSKESPRCSKYICSKRAYNSLGLKILCSATKQVCRFFISLIRRKTLLLKPNAPCLPAFELDFATFSNALNSVGELPEPPPFDLNNPF
jgi:hypothetical protein